MADEVASKLDLFVEISKTQTAATIEQTKVLHDIKTLLVRQHEESSKHSEKLDLTASKISKLEFASKVHWLIVGSGFLGVIVSIVGVALK